MIDTHAHINSKILKNLSDEIKRINKLDYLNKVINIGDDYETGLESLAIASNFDKFYASLGVHPLKDGKVEDIYRLYNYSNIQDRIVALGETGIDLSKDTDVTIQIRKFIETIELANYLHLPVIIHANKANSLVLDILSKHPVHYGFVFHCFEPNMDILRQIIKKDGFISVCSPITRKTTKKSLEVVSNIPLDNILIETDYPYMCDNPEYVGKRTFQRIKTLRDLDKDELETTLDNNAKRLFKKLK